MSKLLQKVSRHITLEGAWRVVQDNARTSASKEVRQEIDEFARAPGTGIRSISNRLSRSKFEFRPAKGILNEKKDLAGKKTGKFRPIVLAPLESRIVQRALLDVLTEFPRLHTYANTAYSFGGVSKNANSHFEDRNFSGVSAAIDAVLASIKDGAMYFVCADIKGFFTRISKPHVLSIISSIVEDAEFLEFLEKAISLELANMAELRQQAELFPIEELGVAQGNSLSPLLGNITLAAFDLEMNRGEGRCIRYVDDFIILARSQKAANAQLRKAKRLLGQLQMELSPEKSSRGPCSIKDGICFLGVEIIPGYIRPMAKKQRSLLTSIEAEFRKSRSAYAKTLGGGHIDSRRSFVATLRRVDGAIDAWGKAYWFCNDLDFFKRTDVQIHAQTREFIKAYRRIVLQVDAEKAHSLLGISKLGDRRRSGFKYPSVSSSRITPAASP